MLFQELGVGIEAKTLGIYLFARYYTKETVWYGAGRSDKVLPPHTYVTIIRTDHQNLSERCDCENTRLWDSRSHKYLGT